LTTEQLQAARAEKWRQKANPLLTAEDADTWVESTGVGLFLPRKTQLQAPAPSFVEATIGETNPTPPPAAIQNAFDLATRLFAAEKATPLNLLGGVSEQPDFLVSPEALPYIFAMRGDRDWKRGPRDKSSPLVVDTWKVLKREGALTVSELQGQLGREVTEAAVLRSLSELWAAMRVLPVYSAGEATAWELFESRHQKAMQTGGGMAQATALSALVSLYLDSAIAATTEEIETFLSPLASRSRIGEVVRGLAATRQLLTISLGPQTLLYIAGGLPEFPEIEAPADAQTQTEAQTEAAPRERRPFAPRTPSDRAPRRERPPFKERPAAGGERRSASPGWKRPGSERPRKEWQPRSERPDSGPSESRPRRATGDTGFKKPFRPRTGESSGSAPRKDWKPRPQQGEFRPRREGTAQGGFKKPYRSRTGDQPPGVKFPRREGEQPREFRPRRTEGGVRGGAGFSKPFRDRPSGTRPAGKFSPRDRDSQRPPRKEWTPRREGAAGEERREFRPRRAEGGASFSKPFRKRDSGDERPAGKFPPRDRDSQRPPRKEWKPRREGAAGEERREFRPRRTGESTERREFKPRSSADGGFRPRREAGSSTGRPKPPGEKRFGERRSFENREGREGFDRKKPLQREGREPGAKRPAKSFSKSGGRAGKSFGPSKSGGRKPAFGAKRPSRPGGKPPFGKRPNNRKGKKSGE
jgi:23S rRNA pseudouridine2605 synthase